MKKLIKIKQENFFEKYQILLGETIEFAMQKQQANNLKCLIIINKKDEFVGTLSDGDIRDAILKKKKLNYKINSLVNRKPCFFYENNYDLNKVKKIIFNQEFPFVPIINKRKKLVNIYNSKSFGKKKFEKKLDIPVVIMAGGRGTRLQPSTHILPKPLIPVQGKAIIEHIILEFKNYGIEDYFISLNYKSLLVKAFFSQLKLNCNIKYLNEKKPLGTAGSLKLLSKFKKENYLVINCDTIIKSDFNDFLNFHKENKNDISVIGSTNKIQIPYGVCEIDKKQRLKKIDEKPSIDFISNTGCYLINKKVLKLIPKDKTFDFTDLVELAIKKKYRVGLYPINEKSWIDAGSLDHISRIRGL